MAMGGIGEAAMLGAVMGGGSAMLTGGDPLKGALMGGLTGGAGAGISGMLPGAAGAVTPGVIPAVTEAAVTNAAINPYTTASTAFNSAATTLPNAVNAAINPIATSSVPGAVSSGINVLPNGLPPDISKSILGSPAFASTPSAVTPSAAAAPSGVAPTSLSNSSNIGEFIKPSYSIAPPINPANSAAAPVAAAPATPAPPSTFMEGVAKFAKDPMSSLMNNKFTAAGSALAGANAGKKKKEEEEEYSGPLSRFKYNPDSYRPSSYADGGIANLYSGGYDQMVGEEPMYMSNMAAGGIANLGSYSDGGRMLKGPGDGMSDSIPASISGKRPARLADGEFVVPADVVSHLGNGSTDAGAKQLYAMMNKVRQARTGRKAQGREFNPRQYVPA